MSGGQRGIFRFVSIPGIKYSKRSPKVSALGTSAVYGGWTIMPSDEDGAAIRAVLPHWGCWQLDCVKSLKIAFELWFGFGGGGES
jgi:hypothetical protein